MQVFNTMQNYFNILQNKHMVQTYKERNMQNTYIMYVEDDQSYVAELMHEVAKTFYLFF